MELTVDYCVECGYREKAVKAAEAILEEFEDELESARLVPSGGGIFRLSIDGQIVFDIEKQEFSRDKVIQAAAEKVRE